MVEDQHIDTQLHRYFDGDLPPDQAAALRRRIDADPAVRAKLEGLAELRALVRAAAEASAADLPSEELWSRIEARIAVQRAKDERGERAAGASQAEARPAAGLRVVAGGRADEGPADEGRAGEARAAPPVARSAERRRRRMFGLMVAGLALAAALLLAVIASDANGPEAGPVADVGRGAGRDLQRPTASELVLRTEVLAVDFGDRSGAIFAIEGENGGRYAVVWLDDGEKSTALK
jgi:hypothetical protein